jgi:hypothetical protein
MLLLYCAPASNHHNGYTSGTEDCPFRAETTLTLAARAIFRLPGDMRRAA